MFWFKKEFAWVNARINIFRYKIINQIFVQLNGLSGNIFLLTWLFNVKITNNLFNFITASFLKRKVESSALALILTTHRCLSKNLVTDIIVPRLSLAIWKDLGFGYFKVGTTLRKNWLNVLQISSSLDLLLPSSMRLILSHFDEFWVNIGIAVLQKLLLSVIVLVSRFSK